MTDTLSLYPSPIGAIVLEAKTGGIARLWFSHEPAPPLPSPTLPADVEALQMAHQWLAQYFGGEVPSVEVPLALSLSPFAQQVTAVVRSITYGRSATYGTVSQLVAKHYGRSSAQAVGNAMARNPVALIIPCHRIVAAHSIGGYAFGIERKQWLLQWERQHLYE